MPRHNVGVVLHLRDDDFVISLAKLFGEDCCQQIDAFGGAAGEDDFVCVVCANEFRNGFARLFVCQRGLYAQIMHAAVNVGVLCGIDARNLVDDALRLLCGGGVVEIDERLAIDFLFQNGKIGAYFFDIKHLGNLHFS